MRSARPPSVDPSPATAGCSSKRRTSMADSISRTFAHFIHGLALGDLPATTVAHAKLRLLDCLGTGLAARGLKVPAVALAFVGGNSGPATVLGRSERLPVIDAAFVNATLINGRSEDD